MHIYFARTHTRTQMSKVGKFLESFLLSSHKAETRANMTHIANSKSERKSLRKTNIYVLCTLKASNAQNESAVCHSIAPPFGRNVFGFVSRTQTHTHARTHTAYR